MIFDDYSRFTWVFFLSHKNEAFHTFASDSKRVQNEKGYTINSIRSDRGGEFSCEPLESYCEEHGILHNFFAPRTPQQNGVVERKNRTLQEMARTMLNENGLPKYVWTEAVNTACYVVERAYIHSILKRTLYELWNGRSPNISYFYAFGCKYFVHNNG